MSGLISCIPYLSAACQIADFRETLKTYMNINSYRDSWGIIAYTCNELFMNTTRAFALTFRAYVNLLYPEDIADYFVTASRSGFNASMLPFEVLSAPLGFIAGMREGDQRLKLLALASTFRIIRMAGVIFTFLALPEYVLATLVAELTIRAIVWLRY